MHHLQAHANKLDWEPMLHKHDLDRVTSQSSVHPSVFVSKHEVVPSASPPALSCHQQNTCRSLLLSLPSAGMTSIVTPVLHYLELQEISVPLLTTTTFRTSCHDSEHWHFGTEQAQNLACALIGGSYDFSVTVLLVVVSRLCSIPNSHSPQSKHLRHTVHRQPT